MKARVEVNGPSYQSRCKPVVYHTQGRGSAAVWLATRKGRTAVDRLQYTRHAKGEAGEGSST